MEKSEPAFCTLFVDILLTLEFIFAYIVNISLKTCLDPLCGVNATIHGTQSD